jgi:hypothetical protein
MSADILELLKDDTNYYGPMGKAYLSNSDIGALLSNPKNFGKSRPDNKSFAEGRYFHQLLTEPDKAKVVHVVDASSRNTNLYKDYCKTQGLDFALLKSEVETVEALASTMKANIDFYDAIYRPGNQYEVPAIANIFGVEWKGKTDILCDDMLIDLKTTSDINKFRYSAYSYNYDSQAYIYQMLFGKPLVFYVIDKLTSQLGVFTPSASFIESGERKVRQAVAVFNQFFAPNAWDDINNHYINDTL